MSGASTVRRDVVVLGSTGSIGTQAVDVARHAPDRFRVVAVAAGGSDPVAARRPGRRTAGRGRSGSAARTPPTRCAPAWTRSGPPTRPARACTSAPDATAELAALGCDVVLNAVAGAQGLRATLAALQAGRVVALANKESLIAGGPLVTGLAGAGQLVPVDSEHSALAQCLRAGTRGEVAPAAADRERRPVPRPRPRRAGRRHARAGAGPPHLGHGHARHHQLGHAGQQGPRAHRGAPALRRPLRPHRRRGAPAVGRPLDGRVHRRLDHRPGLAARHAAADRAGPGLAGPRARRGAPRRLDRGPGLDVRTARRRGVPGRRPGPAGRHRRGLRAGRLQRRERGPRRRVPRRHASASCRSSTRSALSWTTG